MNELFGSIPFSQPPAPVRRCNLCLEAGEIGTECKCGNWIGNSSHTTDTAVQEMKRRLLCEHAKNNGWIGSALDDAKAAYQQLNPSKL
jgi:hypothetical protein